MDDSSNILYDKVQTFVIGELLDLADPRAISDNKEDEESYLLAMARKGPRSLENMWKKGSSGGKSLANSSQELPMLQNVITEIALPFLFHKLGKQHKNLRLCVYDDAIYYGSTFLGIYDELKHYQTIYKDVQIQKSFLAGVKSHEAKKDLEERITDDIYYDGMKGSPEEGQVPDGFSHFFVKKLTSDIRSLHTAFEVEFPIVTFKYEGIVNEEQLFAALKSEFGEGTVSRIRHEEGTNYSVILSNYKGAQFTKIRLYPDGDILRIASFAPNSLPNDIFSLERLFPEGDYGVLWQHIVERSSFPDEVNVDNFLAYRKLERQLCKTLVTLANYLISFSAFISIKDKVERAVNGIAPGCEFKGFEEKDLQYLVADKQLCDEIGKKLKKFYENQQVCEALNYNTAYSPVEKIVFEESDFLTSNELMIFEEQNKRMLENSQNLNEALSALFFNQKTLVEKWAGERHGYDSGRLRFGYTFDAIVRQLKGYEKFISSANYLSLALHKWIDTRIDQGSAVPQYVINPDSNKWCRVFRPGENEDALLSHLARYVLFVFRVIDSVEKLGWIDRSFLEDTLCLSVLQYDNNDKKEKTLSTELGIQLIVSEGQIERKLLFKENYCETDTMPVLDYMLKMLILSESNGIVKVSPQLQGKELTQFTTLDKSVEISIGDNIKKLLEDVDSYDASHVFAYETFNKYYLKERYWNYDDSVLNEVLRQGESLVKKIDREGAEDNDLSIVADSYLALHKYIIRNDYWHSLPSHEEFSCQEQLAVMKFLIDFVIVFFYSPNSETLQYLISSFKEKMNSADTAFRQKFQILYNFCNRYKDEQHIDDVLKSEVCKVLLDSFDSLKNETLSTVTPA